MTHRIRLLAGLLLLHQVPGAAPVAGIAFVVAAGIGAERTGERRRGGQRTRTHSPEYAPCELRQENRSPEQV